MSEAKTKNSGIGFGGLLTIVLITLKLTKLIDWSWWWVLATIWIPLGIIAILLMIAGLVAIYKK